MFTKKERVTKDIFSEVFTKGASFNSPSASLKVLKGQALFLFTVVVSGKVSKKAVDRNLLKRRVRYIIRKHRSEFQTNINLIVFLKPEANKQDFKQLETNILSLLKQAKIII